MMIMMTDGVVCQIERIECSLLRTFCTVWSDNHSGHHHACHDNHSGASKALRDNLHRERMFAYGHRPNQGDTVPQNRGPGEHFSFSFFVFHVGGCVQPGNLTKLRRSFS